MKTFEEWRCGLLEIEKYEIPRWSHWKPGQDAQVHVFSDAALHLYGACAYLHTEDRDGVVHVTLLMSKARIFPLNEKQSGLHGSMPKKELLQIFAKSWEKP